MARAAVLISISSRRGRQREGGSDLISPRLGRGRCGRRGAKASARAQKLPQRPARCRGRALAAASVLGWPGGRARATLHQLPVMPLRDAATSSPRIFAAARLPPSVAASLRSNDAPRALLGTAFCAFLQAGYTQGPPQRADSRPSAGLSTPQSTPPRRRRSLSWFGPEPNPHPRAFVSLPRPQEATGPQSRPHTQSRPTTPITLP